jgi:hypothetical protein
MEHVEMKYGDLLELAKPYLEKNDFGVAHIMRVARANNFG